MIAAASLIVMPLLSRAKRRVGIGLVSAAMAADARQTDFCAYLSGILLAQCCLRTLVGRSSGRLGNGSNHCERGHCRLAGENLLRQLSLIPT
jgi:hypothetical protein